MSQFSPGKSTVILDFRGPGSKKAKLEAFEYQDVLHIKEVVSSSEVMLRVVPQYKHLGTIIRL